MSSWVRNSFFQGIYRTLSDIKNQAYDREWVKSLQLKTPVISVGNLTVGGTGKTPMIRHLVQYLNDKGLRATVVSRNYKAESEGIEKVNPLRNGASQFFGDEPTLLANIFPNLSVYVGPQKWKTAQYAENQEKVDVILIDDGFQHRKLHREIDIVLLDATVDLSDYELLPLGKGREEVSSLARAHWICLTKTNLVSQEKLQKLLGLMKYQEHVLQLSYHVLIPEQIRGKKIIAFCGLGQPESFFNSVRMAGGCDLIETLVYPDHYQYTKEDLIELQSKLKQSPADYLVTTEKDWIKLKEFGDLSQKIFQIGLETELSGPVEEFYVHLDKIFH